MKGTAPILGEGEGNTAAVVLLVLAAIACVLLGKWQMGRAHEQQALDARAASTETLPELDLGLASPGDGDLFRRASAEGTYDASQQFYLSGRSHNDQVGYQVITPLRLSGTRRYVLVNRGWMPQESVAALVPAGRVHVSGVLARAQVPALRLAGGKGAVRPWLDPREYALETGRSVEPLILLAGDDSSLVPVAARPESKVAMHMGYALQWYAFAAIAGGAAGVLMLRRAFDYA